MGHVKSHIFTTLTGCLVFAFSTANSGYPPAYASPSHQASTQLQNGTPLDATHHVTSVRIFLVAIGDNGRKGKRIGCGDSLVSVSRSVPPTPAPLTTAVRLLINDRHHGVGSGALYNALYRARLTIQHVSMVNGRATIRLRGRLNLGGECDIPRVLGQLSNTAWQFPTVHSVEILLNGSRLRRVLSLKG